jgi:hypothetical protein
VARRRPPVPPVLADGAELVMPAELTYFDPDSGDTFAEHQRRKAAWLRGHGLDPADWQQVSLPGRVPAAWCTPAWDTPCLNDLRYTFTAALPATAAEQTQAWQPPATTIAGLQATIWLQVLRTLAWVFTVLLLAGVTGLLHKQT